MKYRKDLRRGYTTGTCAAAAAKAATYLLQGQDPGGTVEVRLPGGEIATLRIFQKGLEGAEAYASVIKDAGDDPDITNGMEVVARVKKISEDGGRVILRGGEGVGVVTKPGLAVPIGAPAINPVPQKMIQEAVREALQGEPLSLEVTISIPGGEALAPKTLNPRLGIVGGLSILGTTGWVLPYSPEAWTATITAAMKVARAVGLSEVVICAGRASEKAHQQSYNLPEEAYILMGDFLEYSLQEAGKLGFQRVHLVSQWAKALKIARAFLERPQVPEPYGYTTHVRHGRLKPQEMVQILEKTGVSRELFAKGPLHTAREVFERLNEIEERTRRKVYQGVLKMAQAYARKILGNVPVVVYLVDYEGKIVEVVP